MAGLLKKTNIKMAGHKEISATPIQTRATREAPKAQASVIAQEDGFVVIQVVCSCGQEIQLRCAYGNDQQAAPPAAPTTPE